MSHSTVRTEAEIGSCRQVSAEGRKPWHTPRVILSDIVHTDNLSNPPTTDGTPASQVS